MFQLVQCSLCVYKWVKHTLSIVIAVQYMSSIGAAILYLCHAYIGTCYHSLIIMAKAKAIVSHVYFCKQLDMSKFLINCRYEQFVCSIVV